MKKPPNKLYLSKRKELISALAFTAKSLNISHQEIADKTGFERANVSRMLSGKASVSLDNFIKMANAIGVKIDLS